MTGPDTGGLRLKFRMPALFAVLFVLAACSQPPLPEDHFYRLGIVPPPPAVGAPILKGVVQVNRFIAAGVTAGRPIVYAEPDSPNEIKAYHYRFWNEPPAIMLQNDLVGFLRAGRAADRVVTPDFRIEPEYIVTGRIIRFEQIRAERPKVVVELELGLMEAGSGRIVRLDIHRLEVAAADGTVAAAVAAMGTAVTQIYGRFLTDISNK